MLKERLRSLRKAKNLKQEDMCNLVNVSIDTVRRYESGNREPRFAELKKFAEVLNTSIAYLVGETDDPSPIPTFTREALRAAADPQPEPEAPAEPAPTTRTPGKIIKLLGEINDDIAETAGLFTDSEAKTAEMLLHLCIENLETEPADSKVQETAS